MEDKKVYSVADLAEQVGVPRTTITDWLNRFAPYMESETRGKRRVFTDAALAVLKEVATLRDNGQSTHDIEKELAKRHPVQAEIHQEAPSDEPDTTDPVDNALVAPAARVHAEELGKLLSSELSRITQSIEQNQLDAKHLARRSLRWQIVAACLLLLLGAAAVAATAMIINRMNHQQAQINTGNQQVIGQLQQNTAQLTTELDKREKQLSDQNGKLQEMVVILDKSREDYQRNVDKLRQELSTQQTNFEAELKKHSQDTVAKYQAEIAKMRDEFAKQRLDFLESQEKAAALREKMVHAELKLKEAEKLLEDRDKISSEREKLLEERDKLIEELKNKFPELSPAPRNSTNDAAK